MQSISLEDPAKEEGYDDLDGQWDIWKVFLMKKLLRNISLEEIIFCITTQDEKFRVMISLQVICSLQWGSTLRLLKGYKETHLIKNKLE